MGSQTFLLVKQVNASEWLARFDEQLTLLHELLESANDEMDIETIT